MKSSNQPLKHKSLITPGAVIWNEVRYAEMTSLLHMLYLANLHNIIDLKQMYMDHLYQKMDRENIHEVADFAREFNMKEVDQHVKKWCMEKLKTIELPPL